MSSQCEFWPDVSASRPATLVDGLAVWANCFAGCQAATSLEVAGAGVQQPAGPRLQAVSVRLEHWLIICLTGLHCRPETTQACCSPVRWLLEGSVDQAAGRAGTRVQRGARGGPVGSSKDRECLEMSVTVPDQNVQVGPHEARHYSGAAGSQKIAMVGRRSAVARKARCSRVSRKRVFPVTAIKVLKLATMRLPQEPG